MYDHYFYQIATLDLFEKKMLVKVIEGTREKYIPERFVFDINYAKQTCATWPRSGPISAVGTGRWSSAHANPSNTPKSDNYTISHLGKYQGQYYDLIIYDEHEIR